MEIPKLTFAAIEARIEALPKSPSDQVTFSKRAKWGLSAAAAGALLCLVIVKILPSNSLYTVVLAATGLTIEIAGVVVAAFDQIPKKWPTFANDRHEFAEELDFDLPPHVGMLEWLRSFPTDQRETLSKFASHRYDRMTEKLPMLTGSIEKVGALPIVIALYLQFKDMKWPPHPSWLEIFLIFVLLFGYWLSLRQISIRLRLQLYDTLLSKSLAIETNATDG